MPRLLFLLFLLFPQLAWAQQPQVRGQFHSPSIALGDSVPYSLVVELPASSQVLFPAESYADASMEIVHKEAFDSEETATGLRKDSAVYWVRTWEVDSLQEFSLPAFLMSGGDSLALWAEPAVIRYRPQIRTMPDSPAVKSFADIVEVSLFNPWWLYGGVFVLLLLVTVVLLIVFRKKLKQWWQRRLLERQWRTFQRQFPQRPANREQIKRAMHQWKAYLEQLTQEPWKGKTAQELGEEKDQLASIADELMLLERSVYSSRSAEGSAKAYETLLPKAREITDLKREEIEA